MLLCVIHSVHAKLLRNQSCLLCTSSARVTRRAIFAAAGCRTAATQTCIMPSCGPVLIVSRFPPRMQSCTDLSTMNSGKVEDVVGWAKDVGRALCSTLSSIDDFVDSFTAGLCAGMLLKLLTEQACVQACLIFMIYYSEPQFVLCVFLHPLGSISTV
jgi:hypothetical protein